MGCNLFCLNKVGNIDRCDGFKLPLGGSVGIIYPSLLPGFEVFLSRGIKRLNLASHFKCIYFSTFGLFLKERACYDPFS
jgi:hypothetical protein